MSSSISIPLSPTTHTQPFLKPRENNLLFGGSLLPKRLPFPKRRVSYTATRALLSANKESVLHDFHERRALKVRINTFLPIPFLDTTDIHNPNTSLMFSLWVHWFGGGKGGKMLRRSLFVFHCRNINTAYWFLSVFYATPKGGEGANMCSNPSLGGTTPRD